MKKKYLIIVTILIVSMLAMSLVACVSENDAELKDFTGITFNDISVIYDGKEHMIVCSGVPAGATVEYTDNKGTEVGEYNATATISMKGYNKLTLNAKLTIVAKAQEVDITA